jgi:hypothetical protein
MNKPLNEYDAVKNILIKHNALNKTIDDIVELGTDLYHELFSYFQEDMPYGIQKARTGMPDEWIADKLLEMELIKE